jgi:hypothetical protein
MEIAVGILVILDFLSKYLLPCESFRSEFRVGAVRNAAWRVAVVMSDSPRASNVTWYPSATICEMVDVCCHRPRLRHHGPAHTLSLFDAVSTVCRQVRGFLVGNEE